MSERHEAILTRHGDGTVTVEYADPVIWVSPGLLALAEAWVFPNGGEGTIQLDTAGEYVYRRRGVVPAHPAAYLIYERVTDV